MPDVGFAFGFGAKDVGMGHAFSNAKKGMDDMVDGIDEISDASDKKKNGIFDMLAAMRTFSLSHISGQIQDLTGETGNLVNGLEATAVAADQALAPLLARLGKAPGEARKLTGEITGMANAMNRDASSIGETFSAMDQAPKAVQDVFKAMGLDLKGLVKTTEAVGVNAEDLVGSFGDLTLSWGLSAEQAAKLTDDIIGIGQASKMGTIGISNLKDTMSAVDEAFVASGISRTPETISKAITSVQKLAGAFKHGIGGTASESMSLATKMFTAFAGEAKAAHNVSIGLSTEFGSLTQSLMEVGKEFIGEGTIMEAMAKSAEDPVGAMLDLNTAFADAVKSGRMSKTQLDRLEAGFGNVDTQMAFLLTNTTSGTKALQDMANMAPSAEGALKKVGEQGFRTGRTLADQLSFAAEVFETKFRKIGRKDVREFVGSQKRAYKALGKDIQKLGKDKVWGPFVKAISVTAQSGLQGLMHSLGITNDATIKFGLGLRFAAGQAGETLKAISPVMESLTGFIAIGGALGTTSFGEAMFAKIGAGLSTIAAPFKAVFGFGKKLLMFLPTLVASVVGWPITIAAGIVAGLAALFYFAPEVKEWIFDLGEKIWGWIKTGWGKLVKIGEAIAEWWSGIDMGKIVASASVALLDIGRKLGEVAGKLWDKALDVGKVVVDWWRNLDFGKTSKGIWESMVELKNRAIVRIKEIWAAAAPLTDAISSWWKNIDWQKLWSDIKSFAKTLWATCVTILETQWKAIKNVATFISDWWNGIDWHQVGQDVHHFASTLLGLVKKGIKIAWNSILVLAGIVGEWLSGVDWNNVMNKVSQFGQDLVGVIWDGIKIAWNAAVDFGAFIFDVLLGEEKAGEFDSTNEEMEKLGTEGGDKFVGGIKDAFGGIFGWFGDQFSQLGKELGMFWEDNVSRPMSKWTESLKVGIKEWFERKLILPLQEMYYETQVWWEKLWGDSKKQAAAQEELTEVRSRLAKLNEQGWAKGFEDENSAIQKGTNKQRQILLDLGEEFKNKKFKLSDLLTVGSEAETLARSKGMFSPLHKAAQGQLGDLERLVGDSAQKVVDYYPQSPPKNPQSPFHQLPDAGAGIAAQLNKGFEDGLGKVNPMLVNIAGMTVPGAQQIPVRSPPVGMGTAGAKKGVGFDPADLSRVDTGTGEIVRAVYNQTRVIVQIHDLLNDAMNAMQPRKSMIVTAG